MHVYIVTVDGCVMLCTQSIEKVKLYLADSWGYTFEPLLSEEIFGTQVCREDDHEFRIERVEVE